MKYYKSFILFSLFALAFVSCNTDDLEKDIDALKDRVTNVEAQVQQLNDEMNIVRVLLDGNKTITDYSINGDTYTLTLSNGETLTLTPGATGGNYPSITIGDNGNWVIGGVDTGWRAEAEDGEDASITPQFKIEANPADGGKKYWYVSYDNGSTWAMLDNGLAEGTNAGSNPISNVTVNGDNFEVTFGGQKYLIPIVKGLECAINVPEGVANGFWMVAGGGESSFTVQVNLAEGDLVRVNAPAEWKAKLSQYATGATEVTVTVTPPATPSECVIVVEVTHGVNTATDQIKAKTTSDSYWAEYQAGFDIKIRDMVINKYTYPNAELISMANISQFTRFETDKVYFLSTDVVPTAATTVKKYLVLINDNPSNPAKITLGDAMSFMLDYSEDIGEGFLCKDLIIDCAANTKYMFSFGAGENKSEGCAFNQFVMDGCTVKLGAGPLLAHFSNGNKATSIKNLVLESCRFILTGDASKIITLNNANPTFANSTFSIKNNIIYTTSETKQVKLNLLVYANAYTNFVIERNSFINVIPDPSQAYVQTIPDNNSLLAKNIVWNNVGGTARCHWISSKKDEATSLEKANYEDNLVFDQSGGQWLYFRNSNGLPAGMTNGMKLLTESPYASLDFATGTFVLTDTYNGKYGSDIK